MSLRNDLVAEGAQALDGRPAADLEGAASAVLDAFLDTLVDRTDEWLGFAGTEQTEPIRRHVAARLIAVLRGDPDV